MCVYYLMSPKKSGCSVPAEPGQNTRWLQEAACSASLSIIPL